MELPSTRTSLLSRLRDSSDSHAWREFEERYRELLLRFCQRRGLQRADAEDVVQNLFTTLAKGMPQFTYDAERGRFRDYLFRSTRNAMAAWARRTIDRPGALDSSVANSLASPGGDGEGAESALWEEEWVAHHYRLAMTRIRTDFDARNMELFERNVRGESVAELASAYSITEASIYATRRRIRERLRELIAEQVREEDQ
jgi:RNA polymerase sigma-70 factor (ECF subfamily)